MNKIFFDKQFWQAVSILVGTIIGAGVLGIPYVISRSGFIPGLVLIIFLGLASMVLNLMIAETMMRTRFRHQLSGLARKYLGPVYDRLQSLSMIIGIYSGLTAYIIGEGIVLSSLFGVPNDSFRFSLYFLLFGVMVVLIGLRLVKALETIFVFLLVIVLLLICGWSFPSINAANLSSLDLSKLFLPYGVLLFAYAGTSAIFSIKEVLRDRPKLIRPAIIIGSVVPIFLYLIFAVVVVGVTGVNTTDIATIGLGAAVGPQILLMGNFFAALAMATSFFTLGLGLRQLFHFDYKLPGWLAWLLTVIFPTLFFLFVSRDFIKVIGTAGSITFGLTGVLVVFSFWRAKRLGDTKPIFSLPRFKLIGWFLILMFVAGFILTLLELFD
ncbi:TPA: hypothetical protein DF272_01180 [Candidatus Falkowbacteria bacterium]|nr:hypothetical protein [Candidatus Falkowbacteria bacterium]